MKSSVQDPIVALATPSGRGAIAVIRVSGGRPETLLSAAIPPKKLPFPPRSPVLTEFCDFQGAALDHVLVTWYPAPGSYTGEDVIEISCHGSPALTTAILDQMVSAGARLAEPGEFTRRAFLNGKLDLTQAEAVRDLIESHTIFQARVASQQLEGQLSRRLQPLKEQMVDALSHMETSLEFVEDEVVPAAREELLAQLKNVEHQLKDLEETFQIGRLVRDGVEAVIVGATNSGKSSIFNSLLGSSRALVTGIAGTTRVVISEHIDLRGVPMRLLDTAGIRSSADEVEELGIEKALSHLKEADIVLFVLDQNIEFGAFEKKIWADVEGRPHIIVLNKNDLPLRMRVPDFIVHGLSNIVSVSALTGAGMENLREAIWEEISGSKDEVERDRLFLTNLRHRDLIRRARQLLKKGIGAYADGMSEEYPIYDFRRALTALGAITGEVSVDDILDRIFSTFCIGK